jgi:hypothetical protein
MARLIYSAIQSLDGYVRLELVDERRFAGTVYLHYRTST